VSLRSTVFVLLATVLFYVDDAGRPAKRIGGGIWVCSVDPTAVDVTEKDSMFETDSGLLYCKMVQSPEPRQKFRKEKN
jgi:hypothetical protein